MWHEISQSAGFLNSAKDYPYLYIHVDITFDFISVLAEYERITGDQAFLSRHWPATLRAYQYCLSTLDRGDGLPRVPADKMSGNEQDRLTDELTLSAAWVRAAHAMSETGNSSRRSPFPLFGLPRVVSTAADAREILNGCDVTGNGLTFCVGSYGARSDNDLVSWCANLRRGFTSFTCGKSRVKRTVPSTRLSI